jgi:hypothetical protein
MNLLPTSARFEALRARLSVEIACQVGAIFLFMAVIATASSVGFWAWIGFGPMDPSAMTRVASLVAVLGALGMQSVTNGFLWGLLSQRAPAETPAAYTDGLAAAPTHNS